MAQTRPCAGLPGEKIGGKAEEVLQQQSDKKEVRRNDTGWIRDTRQYRKW